MPAGIARVGEDRPTFAAACARLIFSFTCNVASLVKLTLRVSPKTPLACACLFGSVRSQRAQVLHVAWVVAWNLPLLRLMGGS